ncbi:hydantoinase/oxoprolinase family protein [Octadecabacter sp. CECT 8868]|uniref:hydantoinase/oxoprolinase family protein n=1 Tax=Octadecabacter algicola TaxID=2909342 RepID=UPI001F226CBF|nr:hydantoinase/oxoprolinase family protein [Octadecabacter algicola]MCF2905989.1 hydantoinase/oxoprolinase family protein [Octadecabacter algicola]
MAILLGIDTGGTYTDAVLLDDIADKIVSSAKSLTTRPDLSFGIGAAIDAVLSNSDTDPTDVALVSLSTTLATNALIEGQGGRIALIFIGFEQSELDKADLTDAIGSDPVLFVSGGHSHNGAEISSLDIDALSAWLETISLGLTGIAIASRFATRNPEHEIIAREMVRKKLGIPVTCSHELSQSLGGPKRALTAVLNARLIGMIDRLIESVLSHMERREISARLMVVRGDGALISSDLARERPIETILSGPAASIAGAQWLTGEKNALVSDIGGTTTDICLLRNGSPKIDPNGAKVGKYRTMVEAVAMRTFGLGGDSEVTVEDGLDAALFLGPRRVMPVSLLAIDHADLVHESLDRALRLDAAPVEASRFVLGLWTDLPSNLDDREAIIADRLQGGPQRWSDVVRNRIDEPALARLVKRGLVMMVGVTPTDASHVLGLVSDWDGLAATKALSLFGRQRVGGGDRLAKTAQDVAERIVEQMTVQTSLAVLETAFAEEGWDKPAELSLHDLTKFGLRRQSNIARVDVGLAVPLIGLGASAQCYYGAVGERLGCQTILPTDGGVANAIGAVVGQIAIHAEGSITSAGEGAFVVHLPDGPSQFGDKDTAVKTLRDILTASATEQATAAGVEEVRVTESLDLREAQIEAQTMFIEATLRVTASGRPRIAS